MKRFEIVRGLLIAAALATGGCLAESSSPDSSGKTVDEVDSAPVVVVHEGREVEHSATDAVGDAVIHPTGSGLGPSPDPWFGGDPGGPSPDPWVPHARRTPPGGGDPTDTSTSTNTSGSNNNK